MVAELALTMNGRIIMDERQLPDSTEEQSELKESIWRKGKS